MKRSTLLCLGLCGALYALALAFGLWGTRLQVCGALIALLGALTLTILSTGGE